MLEAFTYSADWFILKAGLDKETPVGSAVHFFIEDSAKIFVLLYVLIFCVSLFRSRLSPEKVRDYLSKKSRWSGYFSAVFLGAVTPFCSCSSIPLFVGFLAAGVPFGVSLAFLVSSPLISEIAAFMLLSMGVSGVYIVAIYIISGTIISVFAGYLADRFCMERFLTMNVPKAVPVRCGCSSTRERAVVLIKYAHGFARDIIQSLYPYILIGLAVGAFMHGYVPQDFFVKYMGADNVWAVPFAAVVGIPIYASQAGVVPLVQVLLMKGVPVGTALAAFMSITAVSLPEMMMLKKVFGIKLLLIFTGYLLAAFIVTGYLLNLL